MRTVRLGHESHCAARSAVGCTPGPHKEVFCKELTRRHATSPATPSFPRHAPSLSAASSIINTGTALGLPPGLGTRAGLREATSTSSGPHDSSWDDGGMKSSGARAPGAPAPAHAVPAPGCASSRPSVGPRSPAQREATEPDAGRLPAPPAWATAAGSVCLHCRGCGGSKVTSSTTLVTPATIQ